MTAADVVFSYRRLQYLNDNPAFLVGGVKDIRAVDPYTVQISLSAPDVSFLSALSGPPRRATAPRRYASKRLAVG